MLFLEIAINIMRFLPYQTSYRWSHMIENKQLKLWEKYNIK